MRREKSGLIISGWKALVLPFVLSGLAAGFSRGQEDVAKTPAIALGVAQTGITPAKPVLMSGYEARKTLSTGVHDPLFASALYFSGKGIAVLLITADWPGAAARTLKNRLGQGVVVAVTAGASGDINPIYGPGNDFEEIEAVGFHVGSEAWRTLSRIETYPVHSLQSANAVMTFPGKKPCPDRLPRASYERGPDVQVHLTAFKIGGLVLCGVSGELMNEIGMGIKKESPFSSTFVVTHCNGSSGYICTDKAFSEGGYEVQVTRLMPGSEGLLTRKILELIRSF